MTAPIQAGSLVLALDTGSPWVSVALARGGAVVAVRAGVMERSSNQVLEMMRAVLDEAGARPADLGGILALRGPGSFTGVRIGLATALGFHQALGLPATGVSTFEMLAVAAVPETTPDSIAPDSVVVAAVDALRGELNVQAFAADAKPLGEPELIPGSEIPALFDRLGAPPGGRTVAGFDPLPDWPGILRFQPGAERPLALVAALRAADPGLLWDPGLLISPLYSRPPAVTLPRPRVATGAAGAGR